MTITAVRVVGQATFIPHDVSTPDPQGFFSAPAPAEHKMLRHIGMVAVALFTAIPASSDQLTLPQEARLKAPNPVMVARSCEKVPLTLEQIVRPADLVLYGTVNLIRTYLSEDQRELYSDYEVTPLRVMIQKVAVSTSTPGQARPIIVKQWGGHTTIDGVFVSVEDDDLRPMSSGAEVILVLTLQKDRKYGIDSYAGKLDVSNGRIATSKLSTQGLIGMTVADFEARVRR